MVPFPCMYADMHRALLLHTCAQPPPLAQVEYTLVLGKTWYTKGFCPTPNVGVGPKQPMHFWPSDPHLACRTGSVGYPFCIALECWCSSANLWACTILISIYR